MGHPYRAVGWNRQKKRYDAALVVGVAAFLAAFVGLGSVLRPEATPETLLIRGFGTAALLLLHVILTIGPLCRLNPRLTFLLYNRRHMGVTMFLLALMHGGFATFQFHAWGDENPLVSLLSANARFDSLAHFPFQPLGLAALGILFLMAATSHDFWLANLSAPVWKSLHTLVYFAYALLVMHVALGVLQAETSPILAGSLALGVVWVVGLHLVAGWREHALDRDRAPSAGWVDVCAVDELEEGRARILSVSGERVAVFRYAGQVSALSNACQHQNGPLGEGRVIDGLVTCPWHGYQYRPDCGRSPEPFTERVPTYGVRVRNGRVEVDATPLPAGTPVEPASIPDGDAPR